MRIRGWKTAEADDRTWVPGGKKNKPPRVRGFGYGNFVLSQTAGALVVALPVVVGLLPGRGVLLEFGGQVSSLQCLSLLHGACQGR